MQNKKKTFFNKDFYEILSNIKDYRSPSQNSPLCCTKICLFTNRSLLPLTSSFHVCLHSHKMLWLSGLDSLEDPLNPPNG